MLKMIDDLGEESTKRLGINETSIVNELSEQISRGFSM